MTVNNATSIKDRMKIVEMQAVIDCLGAIFILSQMASDWGIDSKTRYNKDMQTKTELNKNELE